MTFTIQDDNFYLDDQKVFLNSGEIHYFRIKRALWDKHLTAAREAGLTTISTYVPWAWHEPEEGVFDFDGSTLPERDFRGWLELCKSYGLFCIVKPGPFILAEFRGAGLPDWFLSQHGESCKMRNSRGEIVQSDGVSLFNPVYLEKVALWYGQVMPLISKYEISAGGPVILMQICNEIGVFSWLAHQADYSDPVTEHFQKYLLNKFKTISEINRLWETDYPGFAHIELPPDGRHPYRSKADRGRDAEWHLFWRTYYADYLKLLTSMVRDRRVNLPLYHNLPGWIYGNGYEFPVNITMYGELFGNKSEIFFGVDHIPEFLSYRNMHDDRIINDITQAMQGNKPMFAAEFQCGSREYHVVTNPREMELFYKASLAHGLTGWNYYMFSQGKNRARTGYSGDTFYWFNPLTADGERTSAFPLVKRMSQLIHTSEKIIVNAKRKAEICVLFYAPYYATELERPVDGACHLQFIPSAIRRPAYFDGLLKVLQVLNIDYDMADLEQATSESLKKYKQVWVFSTDEMNARDQQLIVDYTRKGGHSNIFPYLPDRETSQKPCTLLRDAIGIHPTGKEVIDSPLIDVLDLKDIKCANPVFTFSETALAGAQAIARTLSGSACGFTKSSGQGSFTHLGTWTGFDTEGHLPMYEALLKTSGAKLRHAEANSAYIAVSERFTGAGSAILFAGNYHNEAHASKIIYTHPKTGENVYIPYLHGELVLPALYSILTPVGLEITPGLTLLHCTSDITGIQVSGHQVEITLFGDRDMPGEIVFEGDKAVHIKIVDPKFFNAYANGSRFVVSYHHKHLEEIVLTFQTI